MPVSLFNRVRGAASLHYIGQDFATNNVVAWETELKPFDIMSDAEGPISKRTGGRLVTVTVPLIGAWTAAQIAVLFPQLYLNPRIGDFNTPMRQATSADHTAGTWTVTAHGYLTGTGVRVGAPGAGAALPAGMAVNTTYYANASDANTLKFYDTEAHAIAGGGPGLVAFTDNGTGALWVIQNTPLIITTTDGTQLTLWNAAIVEMPPLSLGPLNSAMKSVKFEGYTLHGKSWSDANSLYTLGAGAITAAPPDQSQVPTVPYTVDWGAVMGLEPREAIDLSFTASLDEVGSQSSGLACRSIKKVEAKVDFVPTNLDAGTLQTQLALQGGSAAPGQALPSAVLNIYGPGNDPYIRVNGATLVNDPLRFGASADRVDKLSFQNVRTETDGVLDPIAFVGTAAPGA